MMGLNVSRAGARNATSKLRPVTVAYANDVTRPEMAITANYSRREETFSELAQSLACAFVYEDRAFGMMKEGNPTLAPFKLVGLRHKKGAFLFPLEDARKIIVNPARGDDQRYSRPDDDAGGLEL